MGLFFRLSRRNRVHCAVPATKGGDETPHELSHVSLAYGLANVRPVVHIDKGHAICDARMQKVVRSIAKGFILVWPR